MSTLRAMLRLEDKVAAEGRRLDHLGGPPMTGIASIAFIAAAALHGALLLLPAARIAPRPREASVPGELPLVWRLAAPHAEAEADPAVPVAPTGRPVGPTVPVLTAATTPATGMDPVLEPAPDVRATAAPADVEPVIPWPDPPPSSLEPENPSRGRAADPDDAVPALLTRVAPAYPLAARALGAEGQVTVRLAVLPDGRVGEAIVEQCTRRGLGFETAALEAVRQWRYETARYQDGSRTVIVTVDFKRQEGAP